MKKIHFPKITLPFSKKKPTEPLWKIQTKVFQLPETHITKTRTDTVKWTSHLSTIWGWIKSYFRTVGWIFFAGMGIIWLIVVFTTPYFQLNPDKISLILKPTELQSWFDQKAILWILRSFAGKNIFAISSKEILEKLSENTRHIYSLEKTLVGNDGIKITLTSFPIRFRAFVGDDIYLLTENGQLINDIPELVDFPILEIYHLVSDPLLGKNTSIMMQDMEIVDDISTFWKKEMTNPIEHLRLYDQEKEIHIKSHNTIYIFRTNTALRELRVLKNLLTQEKINTKNMAYIDMRISGRIYTCARSEKACNENLVRIYGKV